VRTRAIEARDETGRIYANVYSSDVTAAVTAVHAALDEWLDEWVRPAYADESIDPRLHPFFQARINQ
jgi:predicted metal-dependent RNase